MKFVIKEGENGLTVDAVEGFGVCSLLWEIDVDDLRALGSAINDYLNPCRNCDGRKCMDCVTRTYHDDDCKDDCPVCCGPLTEIPSTFKKARGLLGKRVRVKLDRSSESSDPAVMVEGDLMAIGTDGTFEVVEDDGFLHYCWPMLDIEEVASEREPQWEGEILVKAQARNDIAAAVLSAVKQRYDQSLDTGELWTAVDEAARQLVEANRAYHEKYEAIARVKGIVML